MKKIIKLICLLAISNCAYSMNAIRTINLKINLQQTIKPTYLSKTNFKNTENSRHFFNRLDHKAFSDMTVEKCFKNEQSKSNWPRMANLKVDDLTYLMYAIREKNSELAKILIEKGASVNECSSLLCRVWNDRLGTTLDYKDKVAPLEYALHALRNAEWYVNDDNLKQLIEIIKELVKSGATINKCRNEYVIILASRCYQPEIVKLLLDAGAIIDPKILGKSALIETNNLEIAKMLLEAYIDPKFKDKNGKTALDMALENGKFELVELLMQYDK